MCTLFLLFNHIPEYPIAIVSNRDEMHHRPSSSLQGWDGALKCPGTQIYAPRDDLQGGSWFGFLQGKDFRYAVLTNIRDPHLHKKNLQSRGELIPLFLNSNLSPRSFVAFLRKIASQYNGFNLVFGNEKECFYFHSKTSEAKLVWQSSQKKEKIFGLSNGKLNSNWPKVKKTKQLFFQNNFLTMNHRWAYYKNIMQNKEKYPLIDLPITGVSPEIEIFLSSLFIQNETYGTRSTLFFALNPKEKQAEIFEQNYSQSGDLENEVCLGLNR